ncbi:hypothetical protein UlMin_013671 [Ulmus minor]
MISEDGFSLPSTIRSFPHQEQPNPNPNPNPSSANPAAKKKRNLPGTPDPDAEVIALSPKSLMATNRFLCEICNKGFQRDQNLQLHRRGHNLPWKLRQRTSKEIRKKVYVCPEKTCVHHEPSRALGDLTGIKKHFSRKHGEKKWKCEKCSKKYAVQSDWKAHSKICGTREYKCDCGTLFSRKDSFITHRAFCDALAEENARFGAVPTTNPTFINVTNNNNPQSGRIAHMMPQIFPQEFANSDQSLANFSTTTPDGQRPRLPIWLDAANSNTFMGAAGNSSGLQELLQTPNVHMFGSTSTQNQWMNKFSSESMSFNPAASGQVMSPMPRGLKEEEEPKGNLSETMSSLHQNNQNQRQQSCTTSTTAITTPAHMSATALLQKAAQMGSTRSNPAFNGTAFGLMNSSPSNISNFNSFLGNSNTKNLDPLLVQTNNSGSNENNEEGLTRDFLGVGGEASGSLFHQELAKFASMGSAMNLSQYSGHH